MGMVRGQSLTARRGSPTGHVPRRAAFRFRRSAASLMAPTAGKYAANEDESATILGEAQLRRPAELRLIVSRELDPGGWTEIERG